MSSGVTLEQVLNMIKENDFDSVAGSVNDEPHPGEYDDQPLELDEDEEDVGSGSGRNPHWTLQEEDPEMGENWTPEEVADDGSAHSEVDIEDEDEDEEGEDISLQMGALETEESPDREAESSSSDEDLLNLDLDALVAQNQKEPSELLAEDEEDASDEPEVEYIDVELVETNEPTETDLEDLHLPNLDGMASLLADSSQYRSHPMIWDDPSYSDFTSILEKTGDLAEDDQDESEQPSKVMSRIADAMEEMEEIEEEIVEKSAKIMSLQQDISQLTQELSVAHPMKISDIEEDIEEKEEKIEELKEDIAESKAEMASLQDKVDTAASMANGEGASLSKSVIGPGSVSISKGISVERQPSVIASGPASEVSVAKDASGAVKSVQVVGPASEVHEFLKSIAQSQAPEGLQVAEVVSTELPASAVSIAEDSMDSVIAAPASKLQASQASQASLQPPQASIHASQPLSVSQPASKSIQASKSLKDSMQQASLGASQASIGQASKSLEGSMQASRPLGGSQGSMQASKSMSASQKTSKSVGASQPSVQASKSVSTSQKKSNSSAAQSRSASMEASYGARSVRSSQGPTSTMAEAMQAKLPGSSEILIEDEDDPQIPSPQPSTAVEEQPAPSAVKTTQQPFKLSDVFVPKTPSQISAFDQMRALKLAIQESIASGANTMSSVGQMLNRALKTNAVYVPNFGMPTESEQFWASIDSLSPQQVQVVQQMTLSPQYTQLYKEASQVRGRKASVVDFERKIAQVQASLPAVTNLTYRAPKLNLAQPRASNLSYRPPLNY